MRPQMYMPRQLAKAIVNYQDAAGPNAFGPDWQRFFGNTPTPSPSSSPTTPFTPSGGGLVPSSLFGPNFSGNYPGGQWTNAPFSTTPYGMVPGGSGGPTVIIGSNGQPIIWNNTFPLPTGGAGTPGVGGIAGPNTGGLFPGGTGGGGGIPSTGGFGTRGDDSGQVPGVDLSTRDRINMILHNLGLPPIPSNYDPFGAFGGFKNPQDRFFAGQDVDPMSGIRVDPVTGEPNVGNYNPLGPGGGPGTAGIVSPSSPAGGGSFFGGSGNPIVPGSYVVGNLGGSGGNLGPLAWQLAMSHGIWSGAHPFSYDTWRKNQAFWNYQGNPFQNVNLKQWNSTLTSMGLAPVNTLPNMQGYGGIGGSYANYLKTWNDLRNSGATSRFGFGSKIGGTSGVHFEGQGPGGAGRPMTQNR